MKDPYSKEYQDAIRKQVEEYQKSLTGNVIKLGGAGEQNINTNDNIIYESKTEIIKKYAVYSFAILIAILCILLIWGKLR